jgi:hypothetical protein
MERCDRRSGVGGVYGYAIPFAPDREPLPEDIALAYSKVLRTPVSKAIPFGQGRLVELASVSSAPHSSEALDHLIPSMLHRAFSGEL